MNGNAVLSIDPAAKTGLAIIDQDNDLRWYRLIDERTTRQERIAIIQAAAIEHGASAAAIEIPDNLPKTYHSTAAVMLAAGEWAGLCQAAGIDSVTYITPQRWRDAIGMPHRGHKRQTLKRMAVDMCRHLYGLELSPDEADATLMGIAYQSGAR
jgi:hypothetical protein